MKRGEIYFADLDPTRGSETKKTRPVLIVSNNANNKVSPIITVVPITSNLTRIFPFEVLLEIQDTGLKKRSKAQCNQIRTIDRSRIKQETTTYFVNNFILEKINNCLKMHLDLY